MFKHYKRKEIAELRPVTPSEIIRDPHAIIADGISISPADIANGSPKPGDMIARNVKNHKDQWLVAKQYFNDNFEEV